MSAKVHRRRAFRLGGEQERGFYNTVPNILLEIGGFARDTTKMVAHVLREAFMSGQHEAFSAMR
jgi:hypothetical protein